MLKKTAAFLLLLCLMAQSFSNAMIVGGYYVNTESYARNCINKAKPQLHCNGKCQMLKKLKQEQKKDQQNPERRNSGKEEVLSSRSFFATVTDYIPAGAAHRTIETASPLCDRPSSVFHPPGA